VQTAQIAELECERRKLEHDYITVSESKNEIEMRLIDLEGAPQSIKQVPCPCLMETMAYTLLTAIRTFTTLTTLQ
jgi:hypothetical protein